VNSTPAKDPSPLFDHYGQTYDEAMRKSIGFMGQSHEYFTAYKADGIVELLRQHVGPPPQLQVLDVGCGIGKTDRFLAERLGGLTGVDVSTESILRARSDNPTVRYESYDGRHLPFQDGAFDAGFCICVLHHVPPDERVPLLVEVSRVLKPGGLLMIFEHNPWNPLTRLSVARCDFDRDAQLLTRRESVRLLIQAGLSLVVRRYILFSPFRIPGFNRLERRMPSIPLGAQYVVAGRKTP